MALEHITTHTRTTGVGRQLEAELNGFRLLDGGDAALEAFERIQNSVKAYPHETHYPWAARSCV